ncbi:hypothetical protein [Kibdelosporangium phytohabitans]|nr:hypothetical protein [Kibdelosporangium phytohabitans]MBE1469389.1 hypothetical protein [Kibdelosporangium phytohabitans]
MSAGRATDHAEIHAQQDENTLTVDVRGPGRGLDTGRIPNTATA